VVADPAACEHADRDPEQRQRRGPADLGRRVAARGIRYVGSQVMKKYQP
jgi:hypothetical protein